MYKKETPNTLMTRPGIIFLLAFNSLPRLEAPGKEHLGLRANLTFFWGEKEINGPLNHVPLDTGPSRGGWTRECSALHS